MKKKAAKKKINYSTKKGGNKKIKGGKGKNKTKHQNEGGVKKHSGVHKKEDLSLPLRDRMMQRLKSSQFRFMNEELYTMKGKEALSYFKKNEAAFKSYHAGYKQQVDKWPINPLDVVIKTVNKELAKGSVVADFGCGTARLAESLPHLTVHSFDLVALSPLVTVCDISNTPLPDASVDCVVCCLSLMGTNLTDYVREANRILKTGAIFKIAEVESRFEDFNGFLQSMASFGFKVVKTDLERDLFYFIDLKKERNIGKKTKKNLPELSLKPCLYKKR